MDDLMDCTNLKANMVLIHAVCVGSGAPARCLGERVLLGHTSARGGLAGAQGGSVSESGRSRCAVGVAYGAVL